MKISLHASWWKQLCSREYSDHTCHNDIEVQALTLLVASSLLALPFAAANGTACTGLLAAAAGAAAAAAGAVAGVRELLLLLQWGFLAQPAAAVADLRSVV